MRGALVRYTDADGRPAVARMSSAMDADLVVNAGEANAHRRTRGTWVEINPAESLSLVRLWPRQYVRKSVL